MENCSNLLNFTDLKPEFYPLIDFAFKTFIEPLYGDQSAAISKIKSQKDRKCDLLLLKGEPIGLVVYKKSLQSEFGLTHAFELKTLLIFDKKRALKYHAGDVLFDYAEKIAKSQQANFIYATIHDDSLVFRRYIKKHGWKTILKTFSRDNKIAIYVVAKEIKK